ncbi:MAG TPA: helix-turn-helix transcriptional regulator [Chloroflexota bacterium]|nr:helix-turn-helix transcriptional regulator [Chloroflexota bacterium]
MADALPVPHLRELRQRAALTQQQLADTAKVAKATIANAELGSSLRLPTIRKLADALGKEPAELMGKS